MESGSFEPTIVESLKRYWRLVVAITIGLLALSLAATYAQPRSSTWTATATLVVQDPETGALFTQSFAQPGRYVENQVAFLESTLVADATARIISEELGVAVAPADINRNMTVLASAQNDVISLGYSADSEQLAIVGVNAIAEAYREVRSAQARADLKASLTEIENGTKEAQSRIEDIEARLDEVTGARSDQSAIVAELLAEIDELRLAWSTASNAGKADIQIEIEALGRQLEIIQTAGTITSDDPEVEALLRERGLLIDLVAELSSRREQIRVDSAIAGSGVVLSSPAVGATPPPARETARNAILGGAMGVLLGVGAAYFLGLRRRLFTQRSQPEEVFGAPLLGEIPLFADEGISGTLPVVLAPSSAAAEAHRFVAASLSLRRFRSELEHARTNGTGTGQGIVVAVVSGHDGGGKTTTVANTGLAASRDGSRVAVVDGDLGTNALTEMMDSLWSTDAIVDDLPDDIVITTKAADGLRVDLVSADPHADAGWLSAGSAARVLAWLRSQYDLVLIDLPPILSVAYAATTLGAADGALVVIPHGSAVVEAEDMRDRLDLVGTPVLGYVYNKVPLRADMLGTTSGVANRTRLNPSGIDLDDAASV